MNKEKILIIEDECNAYVALAKELQPTYEVIPHYKDENDHDFPIMQTAISNGEICNYVSGIIQENFEDLKLIICDLNFSNDKASSGLRVIRHIRSNISLPQSPIYNALVPIVAHTQYQTDSFPKRALEHGANQVLIKGEDPLRIPIISNLIDLFKMQMKRIDEKSSPYSMHKIKDGLEKFKADYKGQTTAFIMSSYSNKHDSIIKKIKAILNKNGIVGLIAADNEYAEDVFPNIQVYMHCCDFGIGIFTQLDYSSSSTGDDNKLFNPNLFLEVGYMMGLLDKKICYLKEKNCSSLPSDLISRLYKSFDVLNLDDTLPNVLEKWIEERGIIRNKKN